MYKQIVQELKTIEYTNKKLREFGLLVGGIFLVLGIVHPWFFALWAIILGVVLIVLGGLVPGILKIPYAIWMGIAVVLGFFVSHILLVILYVFVMVPIAVIMKIMKHDPLTRAIDSTVSTYWIKRPTNKPESIEQQS